MSCGDIVTVTGRLLASVNNGQATLVEIDQTKIVVVQRAIRVDDDVIVIEELSPYFRKIARVIFCYADGDIKILFHGGNSSVVSRGDVRLASQSEIAEFEKSLQALKKQQAIDSFLQVVDGDLSAQEICEAMSKMTAMLVKKSAVSSSSSSTSSSSCSSSQFNASSDTESNATTK